MYQWEDSETEERVGRHYQLDLGVIHCALLHDFFIIFSEYESVSGSDWNNRELGINLN